MKVFALRLYSLVLLLALVSGLVLPYAHFHQHGHDDHEKEHFCTGSFCYANEHQEKLESCPNSTHLFCEVCDLILPLIQSEDQVLPSVAVFYVEQSPCFCPDLVFGRIERRDQGRAPPFKV